MTYPGPSPQQRLELLAHETFNALGDYAPFAALAEDFRERTRGLDIDVEPDMAWLLWSVKQDRRARRANAGSNGSSSIPTMSRPWR